MKEIRNATSQHQNTVEGYFGKSFNLISAAKIRQTIELF